MARAGYAGRTMRLTLNLAQRMLQFAQARDLVLRNVASVVHAPRGPVSERTGLTVTQAQDLIVALRHEPLGPYFLSMLLLGLRPGEAAALQWRDVELDADPPLIRVTASLRRTATGMERAPTKTPTSRRLLALPTPLAEALRERHSAWSDRGNATPHDSDLVFTNENEQPLDPSNVRRTLSRIGASAGIPGLHPHALRHATASLLSAAGVRLEDIADTLGHRSITVTADVYRHNISPVRLAHVAPLEALMNPPTVQV
jgi:integrase